MGEQRNAIAFKLLNKFLCNVEAFEIIECLNEIIKQDITSTQKKWVLMEVYLKYIHKVKNKAEYAN